MNARWGAAIAVVTVTVAVIVTTQPTVVIVAVLGILAAIVMLARLDGWQRILVALLVLLTSGASANDTLATIAYYPRYVAAALLAAWGFLTYRGAIRPRGQLPRASRWLLHGLRLAVVVAVVSITWSSNRLETVLQTAALIALVANVEFLLTRRWTDRAKITADLKVVFWTIVLLTAAGFLAFLTGAPGSASYFGRLQGLLNNPNLLAAVVAPTLGIGWGLYRETRKAKYVGALAFLAGALFLTETRSAITGVAIAALFLILRAPLVSTVRAGYVILLGLTSYALGASFGIFPVPNLSDGVVSRFAENEGGDILNTRGDVWQQALAEWGSAPVGGVGYGAAPSVLDYRIAEGSLAFSSGSAHNSYLQWFMETGLVGVLPLALSLVAILAVVSRGKLDPLSRGLGAAAITGLVLQIAESAMFGTGQPYPYIFWFAVAALTLTAPLPSPPPSLKAARSHRDRRLVQA